MSNLRIDPRVAAALRLLGLNDTAQAAYTLLLQRESLSLTGLSDLLKLSPDEVKRALGDLGAQRLVIMDESDSPMYSAVSPQERLTTLLTTHQFLIQEARDGLPVIQELFDDSRAGEDANQFVEVLTEPATVLRRITELQTSASKEVLVFDKAPYVASGHEVTNEAIEQLQRGVRVRVLYEKSALDDPAYAEVIRGMRIHGEEQRVVASLPGKLMVVDGRTALIPLGLGPRGRQGLVLLSAASISNMLTELFEATWRSASPLTPAAEDPTSSIPSAETELLVLVAAGLTDAAIARQMGVSRRTVQRRLHGLMQQIGVTSRSQLAIHAERAGYIRPNDASGTQPS